jgi:hypothetical protein
MNRPTPNSDELPSTVRPRTLDIEASEMLQGNRLLAALPVGERLRLGSEMRLVELGMRGQIYIGAVITEFYFPFNCVISVVAAVEDDVAVEVAMIGYERMAGLPAFLGTAASPHRSFCQVPGLALRLKTVTLRRSWLVTAHCTTCCIATPTPCRLSSRKTSPVAGSTPPRNARRGG